MPIPGDEDGTFDTATLIDDPSSLLHDARSSRAINDGGWMDTDHYHDDVPIDSFNEREWKEKYTKMDKIQVNGAIRRQWKMSKIEIKQIIEQCYRLLEKESLRREDFSMHFFGPSSPIFRVFESRLSWDHRKFLKFMMTSCRLAANNWTTAKLYDGDHPQSNMDRVMDRKEYTDCWKEIKTCGIPESRESAANSGTPLWEQLQTVLNDMCRDLVVMNRTGRQLYTIDDDKIHCESNKSSNHDLNAKIVKHPADNRWGTICDAIVTTATMLIVSLQVHIKGRKQHDNLRNQLYNVSFGRDPFTPPNLANIEFHGDRGYFSENTFLAILLLCGCFLTCTCPRGIWLPFVLYNAKSKSKIAEDDKRIQVSEDGMMTYEVREKQFTEGNQTVTLAVGAYRTGSGKVVLAASTVHRRVTMDFVTATQTAGRQWHENRDALIKAGFALDCSSEVGNEMNSTHEEYFQLFQAIPVTQVTTHQGYPEWHIARRFSISSTQAHALLKALLRHDYDLKYECVRTVLEFACKNYNYDNRVEEVQRREQEEEQRQQQQEEDEDGNSQETEEYSDSYLLQVGVPELIEDSERPSFEARLDILLFDADRQTLEEVSSMCTVESFSRLIVVLFHSSLTNHCLCVIVCLFQHR